jgi:hypothetical protein
MNTDTPPVERARQLLTPAPRRADDASDDDVGTANGNGTSRSGGGGAAPATMPRDEAERREDAAVDAAADAAAAAAVAAAAHEDAWEDVMATQNVSTTPTPPTPRAVVFAPFEELPAEALAEMPQPLPPRKPAPRAAAPVPAPAVAAAAARYTSVAAATPDGPNGTRDVSEYMHAFDNPLWERARTGARAAHDCGSGGGGGAQTLGGGNSGDADADADAGADAAAEEAASAAAVEEDARQVAEQLERGMHAAEEAEAEAEAAADLTDEAMGRHHAHRRHAAHTQEEQHDARAAPEGAPPPQAPPKDDSSLRAAAPPPPSYAAHDALRLEEEAHAAAVAAAEAAAMTDAAEAALDGIYSPKDEALLTRRDGGGIIEGGEGARGGVHAADAALRGAAGVSAAALGRTVAAPASSATIELRQELPVSFELPLHVRFGERVALVGTGEALGDWSTQRALPLAWSAGDVWRSAAVMLPADGTFAYKYVVLNGDDGAGGADGATWQRGANNVLMLCPEDAPSVRVCDSWKGDPTQARTHAGPPGATPLAPAERLAAVAGARASTARRERARADAAMRALAAERLAVRALRSEAALAAAVRTQLRALLDAEKRRADMLAARFGAVMSSMHDFRAQVRTSA